MATTTYLKNNAGALTEVRTVETSAGAGDASKIPNLNASGVLDSTVVNSTVTSAGAGSSGKIVALDSSGKIDQTAMPSGVGAETVTATATEAISAGDLVNLYNSTGLKVRKADASNGRQAHGYAPSSISNSASGTVYLEGTNTQVTSRTPGATQFLSAATPGAVTETAPSTAGQIVQVVGYATGTTQFTFEAEQPITLA